MSATSQMVIGGGVPNGRSAHRYPGNLRDVGSRVGPGQLNLRPPGLHTYAPQS
jgi:hypothetical protein